MTRAEITGWIIGGILFFGYLLMIGIHYLFLRKTF
jgi:hypothetical protein